MLFKMRPSLNSQIQMSPLPHPTLHLLQIRPLHSARKEPRQPPSLLLKPRWRFLVNALESLSVIIVGCPAHVNLAELVRPNAVAILLFVASVVSYARHVIILRVGGKRRKSTYTPVSRFFFRLFFFLFPKREIRRRRATWIVSSLRIYTDDGLVIDKLKNFRKRPKNMRLC